ncbi:hypothetical protein PUNSTDRAFT_61743, partial [Punctularia strigosozonata HHB-11173 SS5]|uniref:uncharacterized protein n=1 Tax=Punctularia strigosozonata (strain HHB-11173) TaxID=741275 RepID=UPI000441808F
HIIHTARKHHFDTYQAVADHVGTVKVQQVRQALHDTGYRRRTACHKFYMAAAAAKNRLAWAWENSERDWSTVIWTDESSIETSEFTRHPSKEFLLSNIQPTFRSGRKSIMLWGCIAHNKKGPLVVLETAAMTIGTKLRGGLGGDEYVKQVMQGPLIAWIRAMEEERGQEMLVVEDGASQCSRKEGSGRVGHQEPLTSCKFT